MKIWTDGWITIHSHGATTGAGHGTHVYIGSGGEITKGPKALEGKPIDNLEEPVTYGGDPELRGGHKTIGEFCRHHLAEGKMTTAQIAEAASKAFGGKTSASSVAWYKAQAKKQAVPKEPIPPEVVPEPKVPEPIPEPLPPTPEPEPPKTPEPELPKTAKITAAKKAKAEAKKANMEAIKHPTNNPKTPAERFAAIRKGLSGSMSVSSEKILNHTLGETAKVMDQAGLDHRLFTLRPVTGLSEMQPDIGGAFGGTAVGYYTPSTGRIRIVPNASHSVATLTHEYGHHIDYSFLGLGSKAIHPVPNEKLRQQLVNDIKNEHQQELIRLKDKTKGLHESKQLDVTNPYAVQAAANKYGTNGVRAYACVNPKEWFAESFKAYTFGGYKKKILHENCPNTYAAIERIARGELFQ